MRKKRMSPTAVQALIWGGALAVCAVFAVTVYVATGRGRPVLPEPAPIPVSPAVTPEAAPSAAPAAGVETPTATPAAPEAPPTPKASAARVPQELTEALFVEISAQMLVAADSFTASEVGQRSFERACEGILEDHGVPRADFEKMEAEISGDPSRQARIVDEVLECADRMRHPTRVRAGSNTGGVVDPRRAPPPSPTPR
jgi:hypothetical protein